MGRWMTERQAVRRMSMDENDWGLRAERIRAQQDDARIEVVLTVYSEDQTAWHLSL